MLPKEELWELYHAAYEQYQSEVISGEKKYSRFVNDFISYHLYLGSSDPSVIREHIRNVSAMHELLTDRIDLVEEFFSLQSFSKEDYIQMSHRFNTSDHEVKIPVIIAHFSDSQLSLITHFANEADLFVDLVDVETMRSFFNCTLKKPLVANNSTPVLLLLNVLSQQYMITHSWQQLVASNKLLAPRRTMKPYSKTALSSRLYEAVMKQGHPMEEPYGSLIKKLKETM